MHRRTQCMLCGSSYDGNPVCCVWFHMPLATHLHCFGCGQWASNFSYKCHTHHGICENLDVYWFTLGHSGNNVPGTEEWGMVVKWCQWISQYIRTRPVQAAPSSTHNNRPEMVSIIVNQIEDFQYYMLQELTVIWSLGYGDKIYVSWQVRHLPNVILHTPHRSHPIIFPTKLHQVFFQGKHTTSFEDVYIIK